MKLIFLGPPGSGKGTYASRVGPHYGIPKISTGDLLRAMRDDLKLGAKIRQAQDSGGLVTDEIVFAVVKERLKNPDAEKGFIFDGFPRNLPQAKEMEKFLKADIVVNLNVPDEIIIARISNRRTCKNCNAIFNVLFPSLKPKVEGKCDKCGGELYLRDDDKIESVKHRLEVYREHTGPLIEFYRKKGIMIDVVNDNLDTPPEPVVAEIIEKLEAFKKQHGID